MKLPLAVTLALGCANALALGLGPIQVKSGLNQPLVAEIAVTGTPDETAGLAVALASAADFERVGLSRARVGTPLDFNVVPGGKSGTVIRITSKDAVHDPFLDFLLEVNWAKGKLLREYTVLLDPPVSAPAVKGSSATMSPLKEGPAAASTKSLEPSKPGRAPRTESAPAPSAGAPSTAKAPRGAQAGEYGPVNSGEALWDIANATRPDNSVSIDQMMLALLRNNPGAFYQDNINSLKRGAILRVPSSDEIKATGSAATAAAEVRAQTEAWRSGSGVSTKPTLVADTGTPTSSSKPTASASGSRPGDKLALVPPKAGTGSQATGSSGASGGGSGDASARAELARTKEALASREQESSELKSRVKELEELKTKNERLLSLKDSELAELQKKLKEVQDKASKTPATSTAATTAVTPTSSVSPTSTASSTTSSSASSTPATASSSKPSSSTSSGLTKEDIWGSAASDSGKPASSTTSSTTSPTATTSASSASTTAASTTAVTPTTSNASSTATTVSATPGDGSSASTLPTSSSTPSTTPSTTVTATPSSSATTTTPSSTTAAAKPATPAKVQPLPTPVEEPWYKKTWLLAAAGLGLLAVVVIGLLGFLRKPKKAPAAAAMAPLAPLNDEEHELLDRLALQPDDTAAHLELVSLYYARQEVEKFEDAAQAMYAHLGEHEAAEWEQVKAMGQELAPHNPLFAQDVAGHAGYDSHGHAQESSAFDAFEDSHSAYAPPPSPPAAPAEDPFDFDLTDHSAAPPPPPAKPAPMEDFTLNMPSMDFDRAVHAEPVRTPEPAAVATPAPASRADDDFGIGSEDATGTKLDLAKAYLDMGDPEGARSMLEEVVAEGSAAQKAEANKLLKELR